PPPRHIFPYTTLFRSTRFEKPCYRYGAYASAQAEITGCVAKNASLGLSTHRCCGDTDQRDGPVGASTYPRHTSARHSQCGALALDRKSTRLNSSHVSI